MNYTIFDSHLHMQGGYTGLRTFLQGMDRLRAACGYERMNLAMVPQWDREFVSQNALGIAMKALYPDTSYVYAGLDYYLPDGQEPEDFRAQAERYMEIGFDGIKMVEKPTIRRQLGNVYISGSAYDPFYDYLEEHQIPVLLHVADPETFWVREQCPDFALENGWFYGEGGYLPKEDFYEDAERVFQKHPRLNVVLAHFYFLSDDIDRARRIMDTYPNVKFDLTPGTEMYGNFSKMPERWRQFFIEYGDRILFGTDNGWGTQTPMEEKIDFATGNVAVIRRFLETGDAFQGYDMALRGLSLPSETLEKIYSKNYLRMVGGDPKRANIPAARAYVQMLIDRYEGHDVPHRADIMSQLGECRDLLAGMEG